MNRGMRLLVLKLPSCSPKGRRGAWLPRGSPGRVAAPSTDVSSDPCPGLVNTGGSNPEGPNARVRGLGKGEAQVPGAPKRNYLICRCKWNLL